MADKIQQYLEKMEDIEKKLLDFIEKSSHDIQSFIEYLSKQKITENKQIFKSFLYLLVHISNNYHRSPEFFDKIEQILKNYKKSIQTSFQNPEIFHIFQSNKRILLYLIEIELIIIDDNIFNLINQQKYQELSYIEYFYPEIESFLSNTSKQKYKSQINEDDLENFNIKRKIGENDRNICELIRNDKVVEFITYIEKNNISINSMINYSIYETNQFLSKKNNSFSLIEYSAFFGSEQIFRYLYQKGAQLTSSIWPYIIHGNKPEMVHFLETNNVKTLNDSYQYLIVESIKCHNNEFADYLQNNCSEKEKIYDQFLLKKYLKHYNFKLIKKWDSKQLVEFASSTNLFYYLCKYDYDLIVETLSTLPKIDINNQFKIYHAPQHQKDIVQRIMIKNGDIDDLIKSESEHHFSYDKEKESEYKEDGFQYTYIHDLEVTTGLHCALQRGNLDIVSLLLNLQNINTDNKSRKYYKTINKEIYYTNSDQYFTIKEEKSLLHEAILSGYVDIVRLLVSLKNVDVKEYFILICSYYDSGTTAHDFEHIEGRKTPLLLATEYGYIEIMRFLLSQQNVDINETSETINFKGGGCEVYTQSATKESITPLFAAIKNNNFNTVKFCLSQPTINPNIDFKEIKIDMRKVFIDEISNLFEIKKGRIGNKITTLYASVMSNDIDIVKLLLSNPIIDVNKKSALGLKIRAPLHLAVDEKNIGIIQLLLKRKEINLNILDENDKKPIDHTDDDEIKKLFNSV